MGRSMLGRAERPAFGIALCTTLLTLAFATLKWGVPGVSEASSYIAGVGFCLLWLIAMVAAAFELDLRAGSWVP